MALAALGSLGLWAVAQIGAPPQSFSEWMPAGALLYMESADFGAQLRDWNRSQVKSKWLAGENYRQFLTTRLSLKLAEAYGEFSSAAGFAPDLSQLESIAGTQTALALYDIGRLEFLYISRLPAAQLGQNALIRARPGYQARTAAGQSYFLRQAGDRTAVFAVAGEYLIVATREALLAAALERMSGNTAETSVGQDPWYRDAIRALPADAAGPLDIRLVMDLPAVIATPHFRSYWIHRNSSEFRGYSSFLAQLSRNNGLLEENRIFVRTEESQAAAPQPATAELQRYVPQSTGLSRIWDTASADFAIDLIRQTIFASGQDVPAGGRLAPAAGFEDPVGSAADLQTQIDEAPRQNNDGVLDLEPLRRLAAGAGIEAVLHLESSAAVDGQTFVRHEAAIALRASSPWNAAAVRAALTSAVAPYQTVSDIGLRWREVTRAGITFWQVDGLLPLTIHAAGPTLWIAGSPSLIAAALSQGAAPAADFQPASFVARYNHRAELPPYLRLMRMLDLSETNNYSSFFSENAGSLASALDIVESVAVTVRNDGSARREVVRYRLVQ